MHELSIAISIIDICEEELQKSGESGLEKVVLEIGELSGVEIHALDLALKEAARETMINDAKFFYVQSKGVARCVDCEEDFMISHIYDPCPCCKGFRTILMQGKEIKIRSLETR